MPTPRELARARTEAEIIRLGREQLASVGPANLSLRAIARELGIVSSAIYRYVRSREELLTLLIIDGYTSLGEEVDQAVAAVPKTDHRGRFFALGHAVRRWALGEPARYGLLYGTPVPGYDAPGERTTGPGTRVVVTLADIAEQAWCDGALSLPQQNVAASLGQDLAAVVEQLQLSAPPELVRQVALVWAALFGCVSFEVFGQYGQGTFADPAALFEAQLGQLARLLGLLGLGEEF